MRNIVVTSVVALTFANACGAEPDATETSEAALRAGPTHRIAAQARETVIASDIAGLGMLDKDLQNAWGLAFGATGTPWIAANHTGEALAYADDGTRIFQVAMPPVEMGGSPAAVTGELFSDDLVAFDRDTFIFVSEDGAVIGWQKSMGGTATIRQTVPGAIFKGAAIAELNGNKQLYAADFHNNQIVVFDANYQPIDLRPGKFVDCTLPRHFAPFNIVEHGGLLFVSYAKQDKAAEDDAPGPGNGFVDVYEPDGDFVERLISRGPLDSPWGMAFMAAGKNGCARERLLVGNFGDGRVNVYELGRWGRYIAAELAGALGDKNTGRPLVIPGLWALEFAPDGKGGQSSTLDFTAGPNDEMDGIFGSLTF
jgi:uncharacterized protein (TIGR03118 family)